MSELSSTKKTLHSKATPDVVELLNLKDHPTDDSHGHSANSADIQAKVAVEPSNLPVVDAHAQGLAHNSEITAVDNHASQEFESPETLEENLSHQAPWKRVLKATLPYLAVFLFGLVIYYFFLGKADFSAVLDKIKPAPKTVLNKKETALQTLEKNNLSAYNAWISQYYFDVSDSSIIDPNVDNSGNGLSNFQKYLLNLNPRAYDTLGIGMPDSQALANGINPGTGSPLNEKQKNIVDTYFDMEAIQNRLALSNLRNPNVAGANTGVSNLNNNPSNITQNNQSNSNINPRAGTVNQNNTYIAPQTGVNSIDNSDIDQTRPGLLEIPSLKVSAPLIWTSDPKNFDTDLQSGVVHYPGTAMPGQVGTTYISGHSSNYAWAKGTYNRVFTKLGDLADTASFIITVYTKQGKSVKYHYVVTHRAEYKATDQAQFQNAGAPVVALSTCWPVNTTQKRLVIYGEQTQIEQ